MTVLLWFVIAGLFLSAFLQGRTIRILLRCADAHTKAINELIKAQLATLEHSKLVAKFVGVGTEAGSSSREVV